jgi:hypothetical protein
MDWNWKEIDLPSFTTILSTGQAQPLAPELLPSWAQSSTEFSGAWLYPVGGPLATSTGGLSTRNVQAYIDIERTASKPPALRYYRYLYVKMTDGRVFQAGPIKNLEYKRHRNERPPWLTSYPVGSSS